MATRATYEFVSEWSPTRDSYQSTVIYKHHDGYPEGAAQWLKNVRTAEDFIRKNDEAEITESHDVHGDTEYRYTVRALPARNSEIWVEHRYDWRSWKIIFQGSAEEFQRKYATPTNSIKLLLSNISGLKQKDIAEKLNVSTAQVSKWKNGEAIPKQRLIELDEFFPTNNCIN